MGLLASVPVRKVSKTPKSGSKLGHSPPPYTAFFFFLVGEPRDPKATRELRRQAGRKSGTKAWQEQAKHPRPGEAELCCHDVAQILGTRF